LRQPAGLIIPLSQMGLAVHRVVFDLVSWPTSDDYAEGAWRSTGIGDKREINET
jgi:hypothetical protein